MKLLLVDNDQAVLSSVSESLKGEGHFVFTADTSAEALQTALRELPQLILMELVMPDMDGIDLCYELSKEKKLQNTMFVFHTSRHRDFEQIAAFEAGADDYIVKPIKPRLLNKRINALLKRVKIISSGNGLKHIGSLSINEEYFQAYINNKEIALPKKEFDLLALFCSAPGKIFTRKEICEKIWGKEMLTKSRTLDVHLRKLRTRIGDNYIRTVKKVGFYLEAPTTEAVMDSKQLIRL